MNERNERDEAPQEGQVSGEISIRSAELGDIKAHAVNLAQSTARDVQGDDVRMAMSAVQSVRASDVSATMSAMMQVDTETATLKGCAVSVAESENLDVNVGVVYLALGDQIELTKVGARLAVSKGPLHVERSTIGVAAAQEIEANEVRAGFLVAREVRGTVHALFDTRAAVVFGAAFGAAFAAVQLLRRR